MLLLGKEELERLRERRNLPEFAAAWHNLGAVAAPLLRQPQIEVPKTGLASWGHYYFCPAHNAPLEFDLDNPFQHRCSFGGEILGGDLLYRVWWRKINQLLSQAVQAGAILATVDPERQDLIEGVRRVLLAYAQYYSGYEVRGGIPYNGPGKANCQTLDEAIWIILLAVGYDILRKNFTEKDCVLIEKQLLGECAAFLVEHRERQLHNHQCWIAAAIGVLGLVLNDDKLVQIALYGEWGILEQLEKGVLADGMWCEGTPTYHFYAFEAITTFARLAKNTPFAIHEHRALTKMPLAALRLLLPDNTFPLLNDTTPPLGLAKLAEKPNLAACRFDLSQVAHRLEIALSWYGNSTYEWALSELYLVQKYPRNSLEALLYGVDEIQPVPRPAELSQDYIAGSSGITLLRTSAQTAGLSYLMLKHNPDGGEHDHPDRPGLYFGTPQNTHLAADLGTVPYSLPWHYGYFKNTLTHNTVILNGENQPPPDIKPVEVYNTDNSTRLTAVCDWSKISTGSYAGVVMRRTVIIGKGYILDVFGVKSPRLCKMEYVFHWQAFLKHLYCSNSHPPSKKQYPPNSPYALLEPLVIASASQNFFADWQIASSHEQVGWRIWAAGQPGQTLTAATAPDNPFVRRKNLSFWLLEVNSDTHYFVHIFEPRYTTSEVSNAIVSFDTNLTGGYLEVKIRQEKTAEQWQIAKFDKNSGEAI